MDSTIYFATDHAGFELKNILLEFVREELALQVVDCGAYAYDAEDDFTDYIAKAAREVSARPDSARAIILGGSGQGEAMLANRFHGVRAVVYYGGPKEIIELSRSHNDANVLSLGARFVDQAQVKEAVALWLSTPHKKVEKYDRRIDEIETFSKLKARPVYELVPSLPAKSFDEIEQLLKALRGTASGVQIDIVDGEFAPATSWPFTEENFNEALAQLALYAKDFEIEIDCMCMHPEKYLDQFVSLCAQRVVVHVGSTENYRACIAHAKSHGYRIGFAVTNDTDLSLLSDYIDELDFVQVMGIARIGQQGQPFDERTLDTIATLHAVHPKLQIAVDGAVNANTLASLIQAGATRFAPGSALSKAPDKKAAYEQLMSML